MAGQKNGKEGYVLGWVVIMVLVLMILVTAILFASTAYYRQSFREYNDRQAYLTARSIVQTAAADFTGSGSGELRDVLLEEISAYLKDEPDSESQAAPPDEAADKPTDKPPDKPTDKTDTGYPIPKIKFQLDSTMGSCTMTGYYMPDEDLLILTAEAKKGGSTEIMTVYLQHSPESEEEPWAVLGYERGETQKGGKS
ncbi:hypothetical protein CE91St54_08930 [Hungatella hathewayi]|uniref:Uncharacterized protein n=1 Tax=Hungatella hathewayi TaxID=154046 RepID=A0AA37JGU3_9FIRM|nr:hypothetical protein [Hungatella hathewayi]GKG98962.1 hypothetical protein CE91St55_09440 [Hungatella hathewayi]GKH05785.1 hypothetical protein CE91St54_08930 [Hungatella hathewayi]